MCTRCVSVHMQNPEASGSYMQLRLFTPHELDTSIWGVALQPV